ncbi:MAG: 3-deoxy-D-manno-octulosonic acid transferase [Gemmataceae bacterium]|nr:3-deoxy-D-manno-octulosonic acid transferase [Gemmataceae bacterium]
MPYLLDALYLIALTVSSPWLVYKALTTGKYRRGLLAKFFGQAPLDPDDRCCAWFHGVSVGEIHLLRPIIAAFRKRHPDWQCVVSTTTDTGFEEATKHFGDLSVFYWPLDFSWAVRRALRRVNPTLIVLAEGELWPNFLRAAAARLVPVAVVNARMSPRSFKRYRAIAPLVRPLFRRLSLVAAQTEDYAEGFRALGAESPCRVEATGSVKYDGAASNRHNLKTQELARLLGVTSGDLVWVAGSTQAPEEQRVLDIFRRAKAEHPDLRLILVPRQRERFDEVADLLQHSGQPFVRRSTLTKPLAKAADIVLVDTIGELGAVWGLADLAFVGGSLDGRRGGQNMIEPAAYGAAVVFGPHVWNFRDTVARLLDARAAEQVWDAANLETTVRRLLADPVARQRLGMAARQLVQKQQGATERTLDLLDHFVHGLTRRDIAAA